MMRLIFFLFVLLVVQALAFLPSRTCSTVYRSVKNQKRGFKSSSSLKYALDDLSVQFYDLQLSISNTLETIDQGISPVIALLMVLGGALTSLSPCAVGLLPLTLSYLKRDEPPLSPASSGPLSSYPLRVCSYCLGIVGAFTLLGGTAGVVGSALGPLAQQAGGVKELSLSLLYIFLGLDLLELSPVRVDTSFLSKAMSRERGGGVAGAFLYGVTSALIGSACTTPILAALLATVSQTTPRASATILLLFSLGYALVPLSAGLLSRSVSLQGQGESVSRLFASGLLVGGGYTLVHSLAQ